MMKLKSLLGMSKAPDPRGEVKEGDLEFDAESGEEQRSGEDEGEAEEEEAGDEEEEAGDEEEEEQEEEDEEEKPSEAGVAPGAKGPDHREWKRAEAKSFFYYRCKGDESGSLKSIDTKLGKKVKLRVGKTRKSSAKAGPSAKLSEYTDQARATYMNRWLESLTRLNPYFQRKDAERQQAGQKKRSVIYDVISCVPHVKHKRIVCPAWDKIAKKFVYEHLRFVVCYKAKQTFPVTDDLMRMRAVGMEEGKEHAFVMVQLKKTIASGTLFPIIHDDINEDEIAALAECKTKGYPYHMSQRLNKNVVAVFDSAANNAHLLPATLCWSADQPMSAANCFVWNDCIMICSGGKTVPKGAWLRCFWPGCRFFPPLRNYEILTEAVIKFKARGRARAETKGETEEERQDRFNRLVMLRKHEDRRTSTWAGYARSKAGLPTTSARAAAVNQLNAYSSIVAEEETNFIESKAMKQCERMKAEWAASHPEELSLVAGIITDFRTQFLKIKKDGDFRTAYSVSRAEPVRQYTKAEAKRFQKERAGQSAATVASGSPPPLSPQSAQSVFTPSPAHKRRQRRKKRSAKKKGGGGDPPVEGRFGTVDSSTSESDGGDSDGPDWTVWE